MGLAAHAVALWFFTTSRASAQDGASERARPELQRVVAARHAREKAYEQLLVAEQASSKREDQFMRSWILALLAVVLTSCAPKTPVSDANSFHVLQGTWQWIRFDQAQVHDPFYIRFYSDGRAATWPALKEYVYQINGKFLMIGAGANQSHARVKFQLKGDELTMIDPHTNQFIYHRVVPDLLPGQFMPGQIDKGTTPNLIMNLFTGDPAQSSAPTAH